MADRWLRETVLRAHGADGPVLDELLAYTENAFHPVEGASGPWPLPDEPFVAAWEGYAARAGVVGVLPALREVLPQLRFPVREGIGATDAYRAATLRGDGGGEGEGLVLARPDLLELTLHPTPAGRIPVLVAGERADFVALVRAITRRNEPAEVPGSQGAVIVGGYNNWDRVARLREAWEAEHPGGGWAAHFMAEVVPRKELYQDRFILLSRGPYSAVAAADLGQDEAAWLAASLVIRREHECAHYFTRRVFGSMRNSLHDELIADYAGIVAVAGRFRADWFLRFVGLEAEGAIRPGGRLANYRGTPPLSDDAFAVLGRLVRRAAAALEAAGAGAPAPLRTPAETARTLEALAGLTLEELAAEDGAERVRQRYAGVPATA